ncbi:WD repeat-containing protein 75 [Entelurus aequoreus]|uniref:WD repeat-containing protein 75 n=1 Tax=Entelurus aequoreus TaxID=161455 RepID=UPI002B1D216E|nr:WD repeat-containing protein 75 [Entelurus aequoreus]
MVADTDIRVVHRGGNKINFRSPVITHDSKFLLCASGECVKVYSTATEECIHQLRGHTDLVTGVVLKPTNHLQVYSCSVDGTVKLWDFTDGILIKSYVVGYPMYSIYASANHEGVFFVVTRTKTDKITEHCQLVAVHLPQSSDQLAESLECSAVLANVSSNPQSIAFGRGAEYIASAKAFDLDVFFFKNQKSHRLSLSKHNKKGAKNSFTCLVCHPKEDCIASGHEDGKIRLWRNFNQKEYTCSTLHWHHSAVNSLCFTPEGTNLLSGGVESVLVQWQYGQESQRDFLPRLGGAITHVTVSPDGSLFCTSHADNKITIIQSCVKVCAVIQGLVKGQSVSTGLMVDPRSKSLVLNGKPGHLQFYSLQREKLIFNLDIVQQEYLCDSGLEQFEVVKAAFDASGNWLATVEERKQKTADLEHNLKLWSFDEQIQSFVLNTTISAPHEAEITAMCFCSAGDNPTATLVSTSKDGHFKAWQQVMATHSEDEGSSWACDFVGGYHSLIPKCCCFSADGSLLAVSFQEVVTVWSPASWDLLTTLSQPPGDIRYLCFGRLSCSKYLLATTEKNLLCCWNLLTCSLEWSTSMEISLLLADPLSENMAAFCSQDECTDLFVFKPSEPRPLFCQKAVCPHKVVAAVFTPREKMQENCEESCQWLNQSQLYFLTQHMDLKTFFTKTEENQLMASNKPLVIDDSVAMTPFHLLLGSHRQEQDNPRPLSSEAAERTQPPQSSAAVKELLQTPAHVLPSTPFLCSMFVQSLLISVTDSREEKHADEEMESEKEEEDSEEEMESGVSRPKQASVEGEAAQSAAPPLTRAQAKELRRVKKLDHSWLSSILDC